MAEKVNWGQRAQKGFLASGIDPADRRGHKNYYIDLLQKMALNDVLDLKGDEVVLDFGCGSGRITCWIAPRVKKVIGLEVTPEMIDVAEKNRTAGNVEFVLYDGVNFPEFPFKFDLILSVGVLQIMRGEVLTRTVSGLTDYLRKGRIGYFIEQVSDNPEIGRPKLAEYLQAFQESGLECLQCYPIRRGRWWMLYLIRYGLIPRKWFLKIASKEMDSLRRVKGRVSYYQDYLFLIEKNG
ncbi:MAG: class I SAM-dependent methyltransferase [Syntrophaceae bacterium]|nr:class I SAM-dependent methyltransferase [Syntrophaceae bacterium]